MVPDKASSLARVHISHRVRSVCWELRLRNVVRRQKLVKFHPSITTAVERDQKNFYVFRVYATLLGIKMTAMSAGFDAIRPVITNAIQGTRRVDIFHG